jgi:hypothetical protein
MHAEADVAFGSPSGLAGMDTHSDRELPALRPTVSPQRSLGACRGSRRVARTSEGNEEGIALGVDHLPARCVEGRPKQALVICQRLGVALPSKLLQEPR